MLREDRLAAVGDRLRSDGRVIAADLATELGVPVDMVRRDLRDLAARGVCRRVYGGALRAARPGVAPSQGRERAILSALAEAAIDSLQAGQVVFLDAGRTNLAVAESMPDDLGVTLVTASPAIAAALIGRRGVDLILVGGRIDHATGSALGTLASDALRDLRFDLCLLGACAVAVEGIGAFHIEDAAMKRQVAAASGRVLVAATADKVGTRAPFPIGPLTLVDRLIVEEGAPESEVARIRETGVGLELVPAG